MTMNDPNRPVSQPPASSNSGWISGAIIAGIVVVGVIAWVKWGGDGTKTAANPPAPQSETTGSGGANPPATQSESKGSGVAIPPPAAKAPVTPSETAPIAPETK